MPGLWPFPIPSQLSKVLLHSDGRPGPKGRQRVGPAVRPGEEFRLETSAKGAAQPPWRAGIQLGTYRRSFGDDEQPD